MAKVDSVNGNIRVDRCEHAGAGQDAPILGTVALVAAAVFAYCCINVVKQLTAVLQSDVVPITR